ncbi:MAG: 23S rRNA (pseudouridine(1915)-N(3))-methyltransferase RlmH [Bacteriovoracaceae bacterium]|nr:23S rRNA (pseudouridine(1915)-N(3))-methyltransferase RlmH [Bacteriovoracaceae bacterium]
MKEIVLVTVGKLKDAELEKIESNYSKRLKNPKFKIIESKAYSENKTLEAAEVMKRINDYAGEQSPYIVTLEERGDLYDSQTFSKWIYKILENKAEKIFFVIGGAAGHGDEVLNAKKEMISLSPMTFPHKLARVIMVEQLYRATTIKIGHPYHK